MSGADLRKARQERGWTQVELSTRLGVSQPYVSLLERNHRAVPRRLARRLVGVLGLSPSTLPVNAGGNPLTREQATAGLGALGYPGFAYLKTARPLNPADLLLRTLRAKDVDARVVEALPWVMLRYPDLEWSWLAREAKADDLQNRLGFLLSVARQLAERRGDARTAQNLAVRERSLEASMLKREDAFRESLSDAERRWLRQHRPSEAAHWNLLTTVSVKELCAVF